MDLSNISVREIVPFFALCDMYVGNDSFMHHVTSQSQKPSVVLLINSPRAYTDYSKNHFRLVPHGYNIENITHGTNADPNLISVERVIETINKLKN